VIEKHKRNFITRSNARSWLISKVKGYELKETKYKFILLDQTFLNDKGKRRKSVVKVKVQGHGCGGGWRPTRAKLGTLLVYIYMFK
jgi:hypothetical protein